MAPQETFVELLPSRLSPSRASDYQQCPKLFYYKSLLRLTTPATVATTKGTLAHYAFEKVFDHPRAERTAETAVPYVRTHWAEVGGEAVYEPVLEAGDEAVEAMLVEAENLVRRWFDIEHPENFDPEGREVYLRAQIAGVDLHGYIDRLDKFEADDGTVRWFITDYKTGKVPKDQYLSKAFFAMNVYALLAKQVLGIDPYELRLVYVVNGKRDDIRRQKVTERSLQHIETTLDSLWKRITADARRGQFDPQTGPLCPWCHFQGECPAWASELAGVPILDRDGNERPR
jgi:putative RecB family exonuclease